MINYQLLIFYLISFSVIALAAKQIGESFSRIGLPLISGFLFTGILAGPFLLNLIPTEEIEGIRFIDEVALAFIAYAAGSEINLKIVRGHIQSILKILLSQTIFILGFGVLAFYLAARYIPFMQGMTPLQVFVVGLLGASIMVARSPSSAYAVIREVRARGPFTQKILGATVITDAVVIIIFSTAVSLAQILLESGNSNLWSLFFLIFEIALDVGLGLLLGLLLRGVMSFSNRYIKAVLILGSGYGVFYLSNQLHGIHLAGLPFGIFSEPLLICMIAGFYVGNFTRYAGEFHRATEDLAPMVLLVFFTLVGAELELKVLAQSWLIALVLTAVRLLGVLSGSFVGGSLSRDPIRQNAVLGFAFITQAGVSIGLAKEIGVEFTGWGEHLTTLSIGVIVISQVIGPPLLKWVIGAMGEDHSAAGAGVDTVKDAIIFGLESQSLTLAQQLRSHGWQVKIVCCDHDRSQYADQDIGILCVDGFSLETLEQIELGKAEALVAMLSDEENFRICELAFEHFGTRDKVVRLNNRENFSKFHQLGCLIVDPATAIVGLLDHLVRSPVAASVLLGMETDQDIVDIQVREPALEGIAIRDLRIPLDTRIISVSRDGQVLISHGYTRLKTGDQVMVVGTKESLDELALRFGDI